MLVKERKRYFLLVGAAAIVVGLSLTLSKNQDRLEAVSPINSIKVAPADVVQVPEILRTQRAIPETQSQLTGSLHLHTDDIQSLINEIASKLVADHAHEIQDLAFQVTLKELREDLIRDYPQTGLQIFDQILRKAFPGLAEAILALIAKKDLYDSWLLVELIDLNKMALDEQKEALWRKRYEVFGKEDAEQIWEPEKDQKEERTEAMHTVLNMLNQSKDVAMHDRIYILQSAYDENFFGSVEDLVLDSSNVLSQTLFSMDVVQQELGAMTPEQRQLEIDSVRRQLGFEESQIEWLAKRDKEREQRWQNGYAYMDERGAVEKRYQGEELEQELDALRERYFKEEAATIKKEEELIGFFRYTRQRVYGRN